MASSSGLERLTIRELIVELERFEVSLAGDSGGADPDGRAARREQAIIAELHRRSAHRASPSLPAKPVGITFQEGHP